MVAIDLGGLLQGFADPPPESRPLMRWWWFGPELGRDDIVRQLTVMADAGLGGVEVGFVYPLDSVEHAFLSAEFLADLRFAAETAAGLGLRFDLTLCSGWPFGGPHVTPETASRRVVWDVCEIGAESLELPMAPRWPGEQFVAAFIGEGSQQEPPQAFTRIPELGGSVRVPVGHGPRLVAVARSAPTGQQVKRAAAGAEGHVLDHYSASAMREHLRAVADPLLDAVGPELVSTVFCDSLEAYDADFTPELPRAFAARWAFDSEDAPVGEGAFLDEMWMLRFEAPGADRFRSAYLETLADLFEQNYLRVIHEWAAERGVAFRVQNYGVPPTRLGGYRFADVIEGEGWGWRGIPPTRWAASAAHRLRPLSPVARGESPQTHPEPSANIVSAEVWTWVHSPSLRAVPLDLKGEAHEHFLLGINQLVGHGWPASPAEAPGLGRLFYASGALDDRNAWWPAMPALVRYLSRLCWMLRHGDQVADVTLYLPSADVHDTLASPTGGPAGTRLDLWRACRAHIGDSIPAAIRDAGLDFDLIDDNLLESLDPASVAATGPVVLPHVDRMPARTREWLFAVQAAGGTVLDVRADGAPYAEGSVGRAVSEDGLGAALRACDAPDLEVEPACADVGFVHRRLGEFDVYFVANAGARTRRISVTPRTRRRAWQLWDATTGRIASTGDAHAAIPLELAPYEAAVLVVGDDLLESDNAGGTGVMAAEPDYPTVDARLGNDGAADSDFGGGWTVAFPDADPTVVTLPHDWAPERPHFAGSATYERRFEAASPWDDLMPTRVELDFGEAIDSSAADDAEQGIRGASYRAMVEPPIREIACIELNGIDCGVLYAPPYRVDLTHAIRPGINVLRVTVGNATAAALSRPDVVNARNESIDEARSQYGSRFRMQDLDNAQVGLRSGLLTVPTLRWSMGVGA